MSFLISADTSGGNFERPTDGTHTGRCFQIIDMGSQTGKFGPKDTVRLVFELTAADSEGKRFIVSKEYTKSFSTKSNLYRDISAWRGKPLTDEDLPFDISKLLGQPVMLGINNVSKGEKTYTNIISYMTPPAGVEIAELVADTLIYQIAAHDAVTFAKLPEFVQKRIAKSPEAQAKGVAVGAEESPAYSPTSCPTPAPTAPAQSDFCEVIDYDDDIPF